MVIYDPRHPVSGQGKRCRAVVGNIDMAPTILDLASLPVPKNMDGKSLLPLLDNPAGRVRESMLLINAWGNAPTHELTVVTEDYKYIHWPYAHEMEPQEELYNLTADRYEMNNLVAHPEHRTTLKRMQQHYDQALATWKDECVQGGNYPLFARIYDRHLSWDDKLAAMDNRMRRKYLEWRTDDKKGSGDDKPKKEKNTKRERKPKEERVRRER
jgi:arylsulfatase A-like enzyme